MAGRTAATRPPLATWPANPVFRHIQAACERHHAEHPEFAAVHYVAADQVEECWQLLRQSMRSISWECLAHLPTYPAWLAAQDWTCAYQRHRRNLQLIGLPEALTRMVIDSAGTRPDGEAEAFIKAMPLARFAEPVEISRLVAYLASDEASYSTGSEFIADGGILAGPGY